MRVSRKTLTLLLLAVLLVTFAVIAPAAPAKTLAPNAFGAKAYTVRRPAHADHRCRRHLHRPPDRQAGTPSEVVAAEKVAGWFGDAGYVSTMQPFSYVRRGVTYNSQNVVAFRPADLKRKGAADGRS